MLNQVHGSVNDYEDTCRLIFKNTRHFFSVGAERGGAYSWYFTVHINGTLYGGYTSS